MKYIAFKSSLIGLTTAALLAGAGVASAAGKLNVSNWAEYLAEDTLDNFAKEYDIEVIFTPYDSVAAIDSKLLAGNSGYDVVSHAGSSVARLLKGNILQKIDKTKLPNFKHMSPDVMAQLNKNWDPGHNYMVPYMWGTHGVHFNRELVLQTYPDAPLDSAEIILDPKHLKELAKCGVSFLAEPDDVISLMLGHLGLDPNTTNRADYKKVADLMRELRPYIKTFDNYAYQRMPEKEFCIIFSYGPDGLLAMSQAAEANTGVELEFLLPKVANLWVDAWVIPADAKNVENAHLFMNYMMRPEVAANDSNYTWYATGNKDALPMVDEEVRSNMASYPTPGQVSNMYTFEVLPPKIKRLRTRTWTNFKAGK